MSHSTEVLKNKQATVIKSTIERRHYVTQSYLLLTGIHSFINLVWSNHL